MVGTPNSGGGRAIMPAWVQRSHADLLASMDAQPASDRDSAYCGAVALLGPDNGVVDVASYTLNLDAPEYGPTMLAGMNMIGGAVLQSLLSLMYANLKGDDEFGQLDEADRCEAVRRHFDQALRQWIQQELNIAGQQFQEKVVLEETFGEPDMTIVRGISQVVAAWMKLSEARIDFDAIKFKE